MKTVIDLAREAVNGRIAKNDAETESLIGLDEVTRFAELVRADERNRLATKLVKDFKVAFGDDTCSSWAVWLREQKT